MKKRIDASTNAHVRRGAFYVVVLLAVTLLPLFRPAAEPTTSQRSLTFAERVAHQRAIEEVYWRHRIWPATNAGPKPPLDRVIPREAIEKKVEDYVRNSKALEDYWQRPITADQLQAEMEQYLDPFEEAMELVQSVVGIDETAAASILAATHCLMPAQGPDPRAVP